jgi:hypothetical protein
MDCECQLPHIWCLACKGDKDFSRELADFGIPEFSQPLYANKQNVFSTDATLGVMKREARRFGKTHLQTIFFEALENGTIHTIKVLGVLQGQNIGVKLKGISNGHRYAQRTFHRECSSNMTPNAELQARPEAEAQRKL